MENKIVLSNNAFVRCRFANLNLLQLLKLANALANVFV